jgi:hypothetical protein
VFVEVMLAVFGRRELIYVRGAMDRLSLVTRTTFQGNWMSYASFWPELSRGGRNGAVMVESPRLRKS